MKKSRNRSRDVEYMRHGGRPSQSRAGAGQGADPRDQGARARAQGARSRAHGARRRRAPPPRHRAGPARRRRWPGTTRSSTSPGRAAATRGPRASSLLSDGLGPMTDWYLRRRTAGREVFDGLTPPVVFVANHSSHLDTPTILRAIPFQWRSRTAVAAAADYFYKSRWKANGVALLFNTVPLGRNGGGLDNGATDHVDRLIEDALESAHVPRGDALARRADRQGALRRRRDRRQPRRRPGADLRQRHPRRDAAGPQLAQAQARPAVVAPPQGDGALRRADPRPARASSARRWRRCAPSGTARACPPIPAPSSPAGTTCC